MAYIYLAFPLLLFLLVVLPIPSNWPVVKRRAVDSDSI